MDKKFAIFVVFTSGLAVTALEIAAARLVAPFFGSTIYVWGGSIGTVLFALAVGYWLGGRIIDRVPKRSALRNALLLAGVSALLIPWFYQSLGIGLVHLAGVWKLPVGVAVIVMIGTLFVVPLIGLGMVSPMVFRLAVRDLSNAGSISGLLSGAATMGSLLGTFISAYYTIPTLGSRLTIILSGGLLVILGLSVDRHVARPKLIMTLLVLITFISGTLSFASPVIGREGLQWESESAYQLVQVIEHSPTRYLVHDAGFGIQSSYTPGSAYTNSSYDVFGVLPLLAAPKTRQQVLIIGLGGGSMARLYQQGMTNGQQFSITAVELDQQVVVAAEKFFDLAELDVEVIVNDARQYLRTTDKKFDIIIVDAYTHEMQIPPMLATQEFFQEVRDRLLPGGVVGMNALAFPESRYLPKLLTTIASVFADTREAPFTQGSLNHIIIAGQALDVRRANQPLGPTLDPLRDQLVPRLKEVSAGEDVYTDDRTDLDIRVKPLLR